MLSMVRKSVIAVTIGLIFTAQSALAGVSEEEAKRLDSDLTPVGAQRAGNAAGTIPAWEGGLNGVPASVSFTPGSHYPDPFAADQPLYTVNAANMAQYEAQLTETHKALMSAYPDTYFLKVYPSRRSCAYPEYVYKALKHNAVSAQLTENGDNVAGSRNTSPFPIPQSAREILWNHELRFQGHKIWRESAAAAPTKGGDYTMEIAIDQWIYDYADPELDKIEDLNNILFHFLKRGIAPNNNAGTLMVMHNTINQVQEGRRVWNYRPGERKVKRQQGLGYDSINPTSEGMRTSDNMQVYNGAADRYDWELLGKQEKLIPYNNFHFASPEVKYKDILQKGHLNSEPMRYELHRVWIVEGRLKPGKSHVIASRRLMYQDEDTWMVVATALYGADGKTARVQEGHIFDYYDQPLCALGSDVVYDIDGRRYHVLGLRNEQRPAVFKIEDDPKSFTPVGMRRIGVR